MSGLREVADQYGFFLIDQWGCLHDGDTAHPGAHAAMVGLRATGARIALLSNSSRPAAPSIRLLDRVGFDESLYDAMLTAGEMAAQWLVGERSAGRIDRLLSLLGTPGPESVASVFDLPVTTDVAVADALIVSGIHSTAPEHFDSVLRSAVARGLPLLCLNPDRRSVQPDGSFVWCPGAYAERYRQLGGHVRTWGKPSRAFYQAARRALGDPKGKGLGIGDSFAHDVLGAATDGLDSALVARGIHWRELGLERPGATPRAHRVRDLGRKHGVVPTWFMANVVW